MTALVDIKRCGGPCGRTLPRTSDFFACGGRRRQWYYMCKECVCARKREQYAQMRLAVIQALGGRCAACGEDRVLALDLDHVNDDGAADRQRSAPTYAWLKRWLVDPHTDLQVLCGTCHNIKSRGGDLAPLLIGRVT